LFERTLFLENYFLIFRYLNDEKLTNPSKTFSRIENKKLKLGEDDFPFDKKEITFSKLPNKQKLTIFL